MNRNTDLDVSCPEQVSKVLRAVAQQYRESTGELQSAWQDDQAGRVWSEIAKILDRAADSADKACAKFFV